VTGESLSAPNDLDIATTLFNADGSLRWVHRFEGVGKYADSPRDIVVWKDSVFVTGFTSATHSTYDGVLDMVTLKYDFSGALAWRAIYDGPQHHHDRGLLLALDNSGNVIVAGQSAGSSKGITLLKYAH
jgi:hypothetical protein